MKLPSIFRYFVPVPKHVELTRPTVETDYVLRLRQEAAAKRLGDNSIKPVLDPKRKALSDAVARGDELTVKRLTRELAGRQ